MDFNGRFPPVRIADRGAAEAPIIDLLRKFYRGWIGWRLRRLAQRLVDAGMPPGWLGYRWIRKESVDEYVARWAASEAGAEVEVVHPRARFRNPLPRNFASRDELPDDRGWWGYSMRDVPGRTASATLRLRMKDARILPWVDPDVEYFRPALLTRERSSLELREISFRPVHTRLLRTAGSPARMERATWILERVYDNHSHWLTAHLPKLVLLRDEDQLADVVLPPRLSATMEASLRMLGLDPADFRTFDPSRPLDVAHLTILSTDRFNPALLRPVRAALASPASEPDRRIYVSRARAARRRLLNEDEIWSLLERRGFEKVFFEDMGFREQVALMQQTEALVAPHGAGLTNMMFCPERTAILEIADLGFPNPNFYAVASAMGHRYWLLDANPVGDVHPLEKDLVVDPDHVERLLGQIEEEVG